MEGSGVSQMVRCTVRDLCSLFRRAKTVGQHDVLLVEDNQDHAHLILHGLKRHGIDVSVHHLKDGAAALAYLAECNGQIPSLILLDLRLPKIDGLEVLRTIKTSTKLRVIPVVVLTTSEAEVDIARAYNGYVNSYLVKPVDFEKFQALMKRLGLYWLESNTKPDH